MLKSSRVTFQSLQLYCNILHHTHIRGDHSHYIKPQCSFPRRAGTCPAVSMDPLTIIQTSHNVSIVFITGIFIIYVRYYLVKRSHRHILLFF